MHILFCLSLDSI